MPDESTEARRPLERSEYQRIRELYLEARQRSRQTLDRLVGVGASGALVLSIAFVEKIAPQPQARSSPFLLAGWIALLVSLALSLLSFETASRGFDQAIEQL